MGGLANGFVNLFKNWGKGIGKSVDNFLLDAEARKAIRDEVEKKFQPMIDRARGYESKRAANIKDLDTKLNQSKQKLADDQKAWQDNFNSALAGAKSQRQKDIADYTAQSQTYQNALDKARAGRQSILDQLRASEAKYNRYKTIYTDVSTGDTYILNPKTNAYETIDTFLAKIKPKKQQAFIDSLENFDSRLIDIKNNKVINAFNKSDIKNYKSNSRFDEYSNGIRAQNTNLMDAENQVKQANDALTKWQTNNPNPPSALDEKQFLRDYKKTNGKSPTDFSFNGQNYSSKADLDQAYKDALAHEQSRQGIASRTASGYVSKRDAEIAQRIQDAKDVTKAKLALGALGAGAGAGALYAGAKAIYGGDDTDNIDTTDNTYTGEPDPDFNVKNIPEGQAQLNDEQSDTAPINTGFDPDKADALAAAAYDKGVEDGNSIESSTSDLGNNIAASTGGHTIDDRLFELIKAMQDPYKADAVANYIYSRRGNDPELQRLGWRAWLNKYYGDSLRSKMNIDPSGYNGMHVSGGL